MKISLIIPSYNNLQHLKNVYTSIQKHEPEAEVVLLDDGSNDGTWEWMSQQDCTTYKSDERVGHTILYDKGIAMATNEIVGILHADMILGPNYIENMVKHLKPGTVVCATRIEPPIHPKGEEKIIKDFGMDFDSLDVKGFEIFVNQLQKDFKDQTTKGIFAPWILYKDDFQAIGGHDSTFAPFGYEDSDIFNRWILNGYEMVQSRDAFVYHLTCRGHRWTKGVGIDNSDYKEIMARCARDYQRKWGSWIKNDPFQYPIIPPKYDIGFIINNGNLQLLEALEPWCSEVYIKKPGIGPDDWVWNYIQDEEKKTSFNLRNKVLPYDNEKQNDILVEIDGHRFGNEEYRHIQNLAEIIQGSGEIGEFELENLKITIVQMNTYENDLICSTIY